MTETPPPPPSSEVPPPTAAPVPPPPYGAVPAPAGAAPGKVRSTGVCILLYIVTLGFYGLYWYYQQHEDMKRVTGRGLGGLVALLLAFFVGFVSPFFTGDEIGKLQQQSGRPQTVSALTGLWIFPGIILLIPAIIGFAKLNGALNDQWRSMGAQG